MAAGQGAAQPPLHEVHCIDLQLQLLVRQKGPARLQVQLVERHGRYAEIIRHLQHQLFRIEAEAAALVRGIDGTAQIVKAGNGGHAGQGRRLGSLGLGQARRLRLQAQAGQFALDAIRLQRRIAAFPFGRKIDQPAARRKVFQQLSLVCIQRQALSQASHGLQVQQLGAQLRLFRLAAVGRDKMFGQRGRRQHQAVAGGQRQVAQLDAMAARAEAPLDADTRLERRHHR